MKALSARLIYIIALVVLLTHPGAAQGQATPGQASTGEARAQIPESIEAILESARMISAGMVHTCALTSIGGVKCWGANFNGQLGDGTTVDRVTPVDVIGLSSGVSAISAGGSHTCAITNAGGVKCWGNNYWGQLGDGATENHTTPVDVTSLPGGVSTISAGQDHTCAVTGGGSVKCWGGNYNGQLGDGATEPRHTPVDVVGLTGGVLTVSAGGMHTCAVTSAGGGKCWGNNESGQLGNGATVEAHTPVDVSGLSNGIIFISAGRYHTCARTISGEFKCWGENSSGQLGDGATENRSTPVDVSGLTGVSISAGAFSTCAQTQGAIKCWGNNSYGELGDGTTTNSSVPVDVFSLTSAFLTVSVGQTHACARSVSGAIVCWGDNADSQLGIEEILFSVMPVDVSGLASGVSSVDAGSQHTCAVTTAGGAKCWGLNWDGQLGDGAANDQATPVDVTGLSSGVSAIGAGGDHTCALTDAGGVKCWGANYYGQLGDGTGLNHYTPVDVSGLTSGVSKINVGHYHTCALTSSGGLKCWGPNWYGQLGDNTTETRYSPVDVSGLSSDVAAVSAGESHTCALTVAGGVKCWGDNTYGQLGDGTLEIERHTPVDVVGLSSGVLAISAGNSHTCAVLNNGSVKCWGDNYNGQLGDGTTQNHNIPVEVTGLASSVLTLSAGGAHNMAMLSGGVEAWGANRSGALGNGTTVDAYTPVSVSGLTVGVTAISAGGGHTCAVTDSAGLKCWGGNGHGQLGDGVITQSNIPLPVVGFEFLGVIYLPFVANAWP